MPSTWLASARTPRSRGHRSWLCLGDELWPCQTRPWLLSRGRPQKGLGRAQGRGTVLLWGQSSAGPRTWT